MTAELRDMVLESLHAGEGAAKFFAKQKDENPTAYMTLISKLLPKQVELSGDLAATLILRDFTTGGKSGDSA